MMCHGWECAVPVKSVLLNPYKNTFSFPHSLLCSSALLFYSIHPFMPLLATSSGQRQFPWPGDSEGDSASDGEGAEAVMSPQEIRQDNALSLWWAGPLGPATEGNQEQTAAVVEAWSSVSLASWHKLSPATDIYFRNVLVWIKLIMGQSDSLAIGNMKSQDGKSFLNIKLKH